MRGLRAGLLAESVLVLLLVLVTTFPQAEAFDPIPLKSMQNLCFVKEHGVYVASGTTHLPRCSRATCTVNPDNTIVLRYDTCAYNPKLNTCRMVRPPSVMRKKFPYCCGRIYC